MVAILPTTYHRGMTDGTTPPRARSLPQDVGARLRKVREERGLSLREVSRRVEITPSALSQIETGRSRPSVSTLLAIVTELDSSLDDLFRLPENNGASSTVAEPQIIQPDEPDFIQRSHRRPTIDLGTGVRWQRLTPTTEQPADFLFVTYDVGASSSFEPIAARRFGREYGLVLSGRIRVTLGFDEYELGAEDSIVFDSATSHRVDNIGDAQATAVWCMVDGAERDEASG